MVPPKPSLLVLRCTDVDLTAAFYEDLDFVFVEEQHGRGPRHLSYPGDGWVLELYPLGAGASSPSGPSRLGLRVDDLPRVLAQVGQGTIGSDGHAVVVDPDGRTIDLVEHEAEPLVTAWLSLSTADAVDLSFVGERLGMSSSGVEIAGRPRLLPTGRLGRTASESGWAGGTVTRRTSDVDAVVNELLDRLDGTDGAYLALLHGHALAATISVSVRTNDATAVSSLDRDLLSRLLDLEVELDLNFYGSE